jgi:hypothetical protein
MKDARFIPPYRDGPCAAGVACRLGDGDESQTQRKTQISFFFNFFIFFFFSFPSFVLGIDLSFYGVI